MHCNAQVMRGKMAKVAQHILAKECMTESVIEDIISCNVPMQQVWYGLYESIANLSTSKLKGRFKISDSTHFVCIPIVIEIATMAADFLGSVEKEEDETFYPPKQNGKKPVMLCPSTVRSGFHLKVLSGATEGEIPVTLGELSFVDHKILLRVDVLDPSVVVEDTQIVIAKFTWL